MIDYRVETGRLERLQEFAAYDLDDPALRAELDAASEHVATRTGRPVAFVSLLLDEAQVFAGAHGLTGWLSEVRGTPAEWSFCLHVVLTRGAFLVPDATADARFATSPLVELGLVRSYAGVPLVCPSGEVLGALCVTDDTPGACRQSDLEVLREGGVQVMATLEGYRTARGPVAPARRRWIS